MYLTREANEATLHDLTALAPGSTMAVTFSLPLDLVDEQDRDGWTMSVGAAARSGTAATAAGTSPATWVRPARPVSAGTATGPATRQRIGFHMVQEYARHLGQLDIVCELAGAGTGE